MRLRFAAAVLLLTVSAVAQEEDEPPADPCKHADELAQTILELQEQVAMLVEDAKPICKQKALAKECAWRKVEIDGYLRQIKEIDAERKQAQKACAAQKKKPAP